MNTPSLSATAFLCLGACFALGEYVRRHPTSWLDTIALSLRGQLTPLAAFFTRLGRWYAILALGLLATIVAQLSGSSPLAPLVVLVSQVLSQGAVSRLKAFFRRPRSDRWLLRLEPDLSYPSGHSATSIIFFVPLAYLALHAPSVPPPLADLVACTLCICAAGIPWSRMALGAHYATDVVGGLLFGAGWLCATLAIVHR